MLDASTNEPIHRASLRAGAETATGPDGRFTLQSTSDQLQVTCVGYRPFVLKLAAGAAELEIRLVPDTLRRTESVDVAAGPFAPEPTPSINLAGGELRNLASVLADDPLRAVQGLPGVTSNDDFTAQISLRGAGFARLGVYLDGVVLHSPFHTVQGEPGAGSLTLLSSDMLDQVELHAGPIPPQFADRTAGAIDMRYRDGDRRRRFVRAAVSASNANASFEGPFARGRGSWLVSVRKSYLQYLIQSTSDDPTLAFGFWDMQGRLSYDVQPGHRLSVSVVQGQSGLNREGAENTLGLNSIFKTDYHVTLVNAGSRWTPNSRWLLQNNLAWMRENFDNVNRQIRPLSGGTYGEWVWNSDNTAQWSEQATLLFGANVRRLRDQGFLNRIQTASPPSLRIDDYAARSSRAGLHLDQEFRLWRGRIALRAGGRADHHQSVARSVLSPALSLGITASARTRLHLSFGQAAQFPELSQLFARSGARFLLPERSRYLQASLEQRLDSRTRLRAELWDRADRDLLFRPLFEPRLRPGNRIYTGNTLAPWANSQRGYARGAQVFLQRRSANGLTGWVSYAYTVSRLRDGVLSTAFPADFQQKHAVNVFTSYRLRPTVNLSTRWSYGSGFPVRGFYAGNDLQYRLSHNRNDLLIPSYHRLDFRANKTYIRRGWQMTLYAEVVNLYNRRNIRFDDFRSIDARAGTVRLGFEKMFPVLPSAGLAIEF